MRERLLERKKMRGLRERERESLKEREREREREIKIEMRKSVRERDEESYLFLYREEDRISVNGNRSDIEMDGGKDLNETREMERQKMERLDSDVS